MYVKSNVGILKDQNLLFWQFYIPWNLIFDYFSFVKIYKFTKKPLKLSKMAVFGSTDITKIVFT